jgi:hypothetical protein
MSEEISPLENHGWWMERLRKDAKANQPEALRLADALGLHYAHLTAVFEINRRAAAELRRLHEVEKQRDELLEALKRAEFGMSSHYWGWKSAASDDFKRGIYATVCAAIKKAEGV